MDQDHILRVFRKHGGINIEMDLRSSGRSLHNDRAGHFWVDGAEVRIRSGFGEGKGKLLVSIQHLGLEHFVGTDNRVRNIITIRPGDRRPNRDSHGRRPKTEIINFHFRGRRLRNFR